MSTSNVHLLIDQYKLFELAGKDGYPNDPTGIAGTLSQTAEILGPVSERMAIIEEHDVKGQVAYQETNFELYPMNGDRDRLIHHIIQRIYYRLTFDQPKYLVAVTNDPILHYQLFQKVSAITELRVFVPGTEIPAAFQKAKYDVRLLSDVISNPRPTRYDIRIDYENVHIGLKNKGFSIPPNVLVKAIKRKAASLADTGSIVAYADWDLLSRDTPRNLQRQLAMISGVETRYQPNQKGKNSADIDRKSVV